MAKKINTLAIVTRISKIEIPYLLSFVNFYLEKHGADKMYFLIKAHEETGEIKNYIENKNNIVLEKLKFVKIPKENSLWLKDNEELIKKEVIEDYIFFPDVDEFLVFKKNKKLKDFIQDCPDQVLFLWRMAISDERNSSFSGADLKQLANAVFTKSLIKKEAVHRIIDDHSCLPIKLKDKIVNPNDSQQYINYFKKRLKKDPINRNAYIVHYWSRGFEDAVMKMIYQKFKPENFLVNKKYTSIESISDLLQNDKLPWRLKILAYLSNMQKETKINNVYLQIDHEYVTKIISSLINNEALDKLYNEYIKFKNKIAKYDFPVINHLTKIIKILPSEDILNDKNIPDKYKAKKIFGIGAHQTGNLLLWAALTKLGLKAAHWEDHHRTLLEFISKEMRINEMEKPDEYIDLFSNYNAFIDLPVPIIFKALDKRFPDSKFILTIRDPDKWIDSVKRHLKDMGGLQESDKLFYDRDAFDKKHFLKKYRKHNKEVIKYFKDRPNDLLVVDLCEGGYTLKKNIFSPSYKEDKWTQLCNFLELPHPHIPFPRRNKNTKHNSIKDLKPVNSNVKAFPIFIAGEGRSGTTLLQRIINSSKKTSIWGEHSGFIEGMAKSYSNINKLSKNIQFRNKKFLEDPKNWSGWANCFSKKNIDNHYRQMIEGFFNPNNKTIHWGFKEIRYGFRTLNFLIKLYPEAKFIFIIRNPIDVIKSQKSTFHKQKNIKQISYQWISKNKDYDRFCRQYPKNSFMIKYEDLINTKSLELEKLFSFLNIPFTKEQSDVLKIEEGRNYQSEKVRQTNKIQLNKKQIKTISQITYYAGAKFGYNLNKASMINRITLKIKKTINSILPVKYKK